MNAGCVWKPCHQALSREVDRSRLLDRLIRFLLHLRQKGSWKSCEDCSLGEEKREREEGLM